MRHAAYGLTSGLTLTALVSALVAGCAEDPKGELALGRKSLADKQYEAAEGHFDAYLNQHPAGPRTAEVYYLKGRALEDRPSEDQNQSKGHLQEARLAYIEALKAGTDSRGLEGLIRASLADVAYWQEDYATAAQQGVAAYPLVDDKTTQAWCLYRAGLSLQRLGRFEDADKTLRSVTKFHSGTEPANRAASRIGLRSFNVRIPATRATAASTTSQTLAKQGYPATPDVGGAPGVVVGPFQTYAQASATRQRLEAQYPKAAIVP